MAEHLDKHTIFGPFPDFDPLDTALLFLRTNRYRVVEKSTGAPPPELQIDRSLLDIEDEPAAEDADEAVEEAKTAGEAEPEESDEVEEEPADADASEDEEEESEEADEADDQAEPIAAQSSPVDDDAPPEDAEICLTAKLERGEKWSGILGSNMADLPTRLTLRLDANTIRVDYAVTTTGQLLSDDDRGFWKNEAQALEKYVKGAGELVSVASLESDRASTARRERLGQGLWIAGIVFVIIFVGGIMLSRM